METQGIDAVRPARKPMAVLAGGGRQPFRNEGRCKGCQECPVTRGTAMPGSMSSSECCGVRSGVFEDSYYEPGKSNPGAIPNPDRRAYGLGIRSPMVQSEHLWKRGLKVIPGGSQTLSKAPGCFVDGVTPKYLSHGKGGHVWDVDGNEYIDFCLACFPITLGYSFEPVDEAIKAQLDKGITFSMMHPLEVAVAERLVQRIPSAEMVRFAKNGSDVTAAAVRLARHITGRDHVACCGYHGFQDWYIGTTDRAFGIPEAVKGLTHPFRYNDLRSLEDLFSRYKGQIACVMMEPALFEFPLDGFLEKVKELAREQGALLIFDEMLTGFRFAEGGAQSFFGVVPDLATFGKGIANGMPIGVLTGQERYMRHFDKVFLSTTYGGETLSLAAAVASLDFYTEHDVVRRLWKSGKIVLDNFTRLIRDKGLSEWFEVAGYPVRQQMVFRNKKGDPDYLLTALFQQEMFRRGVLCYGGLGFCYSHTDTDLMITVHAFSETLDVMASALDDGEIRKYIDGTPSQPVFKALRDQKQTAN